MAERSDITVDWGLSPRLIEVALPSAELSTQDQHDTLNSNTLQPGMSDDSLENMDDDFIIDSAGKEDLGGGVEVGITSTLQDAQIAFGRTSPRTSTETITTASTDGQTVTAAGAAFVTDNCARGDWVINWTDRSVTEILVVGGEGSLRCRALSGGVTNLFNLNDVITVWEVAECELSGGNTVAVDDLAATINPLFTTFGRFATRASASSATTQNQDSLNFATYQGAVWIDADNNTGNAQAGVAFPAGTPQQPVLGLADAKAIAAVLGFRRLRFIGNYTFAPGDNVDDFTLVGEGSNQSILDLGSTTSTINTQITTCELTGDVNGALSLTLCHIESLTGIGSTAKETELRQCLLEPGTVLTLNPAAGLRNIHLVECDSGSPGDTPVTLDYNGSSASMTVRSYAGGMNFINATLAGVEISFDGDAHMTLDSSSTEGTWAVRGDVKITDNSGPNVVLKDQGTYTKLLELWSRLGLNPDEPMTTDDDNNVVVGGITLTAVNTATETTQTRSGSL